MHFNSGNAIFGQVKSGAIFTGRREEPRDATNSTVTGRAFVSPHRKSKLTTVGLISLMVLLATAGCAAVVPSRADTPGDCLRTAQARLVQARAWDCLPTLDGQCVPLAPFFDACADLWPDCVLYPKFYLWEREIKVIISATPRGPVSHRVRIYHNILHTCRPDYHDPLRTHGDVAEFYNEAGYFMGLGVYMGQGLYCPLLAPDRESTRGGQ